MPEIGEIQRFKTQYGGKTRIWVACERCGKPRWVDFRKGKPINIIYLQCSNLNKIKHFSFINTPPNHGEIRHAKELNRNGNGRYIWLPCEKCGKYRWVTIKHGQPRSRICQACPKVDKGNHGKWRGGRISATGYIMNRVYQDDPLYPMAGKNHYCMVHRLVMARHLGRCLQDWEKVHHKNGDRTDNRIENLELTMNGAHSRSHSKGYRDGYIKGYNDGKIKRIQELEEQIKRLNLEVIDRRN